MSTETIAITPEARNALLKATTTSGKGQIQVASEALLQQLSGVPPEATLAPHEVTLEEAAETIVNHLAPPHAEFLRQLCRENRRHPAQYILSYCALIYDRGETAVCMGEGDYKVSEGVGRAQIGSTGVCEQCHKSFAIVRVGQKYCPDTDDPVALSCGKIAAIAQIKKLRPPQASRERMAAMRGGAVSDE